MSFDRSPPAAGRARRLAAGLATVVVLGWGGAHGAEILTPLHVVGQSGFHHADSLSDIVMLSDGKTFLSSSQDGSARLWDLESGLELRRYVRSESGGMWGMLLLPGEREFITAGDGGYVTRWELATGKELMTYKHGSTVFRLALRPGGEEFVATDNKNVAILWNLKTGEKIRTFKGHADPVYTAMFITEGKRLLTGASDGKLKMWDVATGKCERTYEKEIDDVYTIQPSPDGSRFAMCSADDKLRVFEAESLRVVWEQELEDDIKVACWSRDGSTIATACGDKRLHVFNAVNGKRVKTIKVGARHHTPLVFSNDGRELISGDERMLYRHEIESGKRIVPRAGAPRVMEGVRALALGNGRVYAAGDDNAIQSWGVEEGKELARFELKSTVATMALSPNGELLATGGSGGAVHLRSATTGRLVRALEGEGRIEDVLFAKGGAWVVSGGTDDKAHLWSVATGIKIRSFEGHTGDVNAVALSQDGLTLITASDDKTARLWEVETGKQLRSFDEVKDTLHGAAALQDGRSFLISANEPELWGWIAPAVRREAPLPGEEIERLIGALAAEKYAQRDAASKALIARGPDILPLLEKVHPDDPEAAFRLRRIKSRIRTARLEGPLITLHEFEKDMTEFASDPTGRFWIALVGWDVDARLVVGEVREGKVRVLQEISDGHSPREIAFSFDGSTVATGNRDGTVGLFRINRD